MSVLDEILSENRKRRDDARRQAEADQKQTQAIVDPETARQEAEARQAKKEELRGLLAELEAEDTDDE